MPTRAELFTRFPFPAVIDNTMRQAWWTCPHLFFRAHVQGLRRADLTSDGLRIPTKNVHLHFGGSLARGLEITRIAYFTGHNAEDALMQGAAALLAEWGLSEPPAPTNRNEENKTLTNCLLAHDGYFRYFPLDDNEHAVALQDGRPLVEVNGALPIPGVTHPLTGEPLLYAGRFDAICARQRKLWGLDDKSTGSNVDSASWRSQWTLAGQFSGYTWLAAEWGYTIDGFLIHGIQVLKDSTKFAEAITPRPRWLLREWLAQLRYDCGEMIKQYRDFIIQAEREGVDKLPAPHPFGRAYGSACHAYNRPCSYLDDLCSQPTPEAFVDHNFIVERWDPMHRSVDA